MDKCFCLKCSEFAGIMSVHCQLDRLKKRQQYIGSTVRETLKDDTEEYHIQLRTEPSSQKSSRSESINESQIMNKSSYQLRVINPTKLKNLLTSFCNETDENTGFLEQDSPKDDTEKPQIDLKTLPVPENNDNRISVVDLTNISLKKSKNFLDALTYIKLPEQPVVKLKVVNLSNLKNALITVRDFNNEEAYKQLVKKLDIMAAECRILARDYKEGYAPELGELCLVLYDPPFDWYRAVCFKISPDGQHFFIQSVDYGFCDNVPKIKIMPITKRYLFPTCTYNCRIVIAGPLMTRFTRELSKLKVFHCQVVWNEELKFYDILRW